MDFSKYNIRVNGVSPGYIKTDMTKKSRNNKKEYLRRINRTMNKTFGKPEDIANTVIFLASEKSKYINAAEIIVDGGFLKKEFNEKNYDFIAVITARAGSKSVKNKNIKKLITILLAYTIEAAKRSKYIKEIYVSTDGNKIAKVAKKYGAKVIKRPKSLSGGVVMPDLAVTHVIKSLENKDEFNFKNVVFFQPTSALRRHGDVDKAIEIFKKEKLDSLFRVQICMLQYGGNLAKK